MKVKNIVFSGFMAMVLAGACGAANAEIIVASQKYVDDKVTTLNTKDTELAGKITALETANADGGSVATAIAGAQTAADKAQTAADKAQSDVDDLAGKMNLESPTSDLSTALAAKEDNKNKITTANATYFTNGKVADDALKTMESDNTNFPTIAAAVQIADAKALAVVNEINETAGDLGELSGNVGTLIANDQTPGSVAYQVKQEETRAMAAEAQALADAKAYTDDLANGAVKDNADAIATLNGDASTEGSVAAAVKAEADRTDDALLLKEDVANKVATDSAYSQLSPEQQAKAYPTYGAMVTYVGNVQNNLNTDVAANTNAIGVLNGGENDAGSVAAAVKDEADRAKAAEQANADAITGLADGAVQDNTDAIAAINDGTTGILATAKAYTDTEMAKFYANAETCITNSASKNCIMSAKLDAEDNVQYVWISLTNPAE